MEQANLAITDLLQLCENGDYYQNFFAGSEEFTLKISKVATSGENEVRICLIPPGQYWGAEIYWLDTSGVTKFCQCINPLITLTPAQTPFVRPLPTNDNHQAKLQLPDFRRIHANEVLAFLGLYLAVLVVC